MNYHRDSLRKSIENLHLNNRAQNALDNHGIETIEELLALRDKEFNGVSGIGCKTIQNIEKAIDLFEYQEGYKEEDYRETIFQYHESNPNSILKFQEAAKATLEKQKDNRLLEVLTRRFGLFGSDVYTLQEIGIYYDLSRERIRQLENKGVKIIDQYLSGIKYSIDWKVPRNFIQEYKALRELILESGDTVLRKEILEIVGTRYNFDIGTKKIPLNFIMAVFGFNPLNSARYSQSVQFEKTWILNKDLDVKNIRETVKTTRDYLKEVVEEKSFFDIKINIARRIDNGISNELIYSALKICSEIESREKEKYRLKFQFLSTLTDKAFRILNEYGDPLHAKEIVKKINHRYVKNNLEADAVEKSLRSELVSDQRFEPIGKSGKWFLSEWDHVSKETIADLIKRFFHEKQSKAKIDEICDFVLFHRPSVPKSSVVTILKIQEEDFTRVDEKNYELSAWGSKPYEKSSNWKKRESYKEIKLKLIKIIEDFFNQKDSNISSLSNLKSEINEKADIPDSTLSLWLNKIEIIDILPDPDNRRRKIAKFKGVSEERVSNFLSTGRESKSEHIYKEVKSYLEKQPDKRALIKDVRDYLNDNFNYKHPLIYQKISELEDQDEIGKEIIENDHYCFLIIDEEEFEAIVSNFGDKIELIKDENLKKDLSKLVNTVSIDNIDQNLFQIGKHFENQLYQLLSTAKGKGLFNISKRDLSTLAKMINCVVENEIIKKEHHLTLLREIRNERAHEIASVEHRKKLMNHFPFVGEMYIKYIVQFENKLIEIKKINS